MTPIAIRLAALTFIGVFIAVCLIGGVWIHRVDALPKAS